MPADRSDQILRAAAAAFARRGFHATTVQDIATEAGISAGLLYRYFAGKDDVVVALVETYVADLHTAIEQAETLAAAVDAVFSYTADLPGGAQTDGRLFLDVLAEALRNPRVDAVVRTADARVSVALADKIQAAQRAGEADASLDPDAAADLVLALADGLALRAARADASLPDLEASLTDLLARFLAPR